jgi:diacylglycerol kinase (ATP)
MIASPPPNTRPTETIAAGHEPQARYRRSTLVSSFRYAFAGIRYLLWTQRNAKIHSALGVLAIIFGLLLGLAQAEWLAVILTITIVFVAEGFNTAIEATVDLAMPEYHPLAKVAKDVAAGTVLLTAIAAIIVGLIVFLPHLLLLKGWLGL